MLRKQQPKQDGALVIAASIMAAIGFAGRDHSKFADGHGYGFGFFAPGKDGNGEAGARELKRGGCIDDKVIEAWYSAF
jgi:hypothetical protein